MKSILQQHIDADIGINIEHPTQIDTARLLAVEESWFTVRRDADENVYHIPFANISKMIEHPDGVQVGGLFRQSRTYALVIKIGHIVDFMPT